MDDCSLCNCWSISFYFKYNGTINQKGQALVLLEVQYMSRKGVRRGRINRESEVPIIPFPV